VEGKPIFVGLDRGSGPVPYSRVRAGGGTQHGAARQSWPRFALACPGPHRRAGARPGEEPGKRRPLRKRAHRSPLRPFGERTQPATEEREPAEPSRHMRQTSSPVRLRSYSKS